MGSRLASNCGALPGYQRAVIRVHINRQPAVPHLVENLGSGTNDSGGDGLGELLDGLIDRLFARRQPDAVHVPPSRPKNQTEDSASHCVPELVGAVPQRTIRYAERPACL